MIIRTCSSSSHTSNTTTSNNNNNNNSHVTFNLQAVSRWSFVKYMYSSPADSP